MTGSPNTSPLRPEKCTESVEIRSQTYVSFGIWMGAGGDTQLHPVAIGASMGKHCACTALQTL